LLPLDSVRGLEKQLARGIHADFHIDDLVGYGLELTNGPPKLFARLGVLNALL
jgi:hypothetical protein